MSLSHWCPKICDGSWVRYNVDGYVVAYVGTDPTTSNDGIFAIVNINKDSRFRNRVHTVDQGKRQTDELLALLDRDGFIGFNLPVDEAAAEAQCLHCNPLKR